MSALELLHDRVRALKYKIDVDYKLNNDLTVSEALDQLNIAINNHINSHANLNKLFNTLNKSSLKLYQEKFDIEQIEIERSFVEANLEIIESALSKLSVLRARTDYKIDIDITILSKQDKIYRIALEEKNLRFKYNALIIRSMNLLQNYLKLNDNMNKFYSEASLKVGSTTKMAPIINETKQAF